VEPRPFRQVLANTGYYGALRTKFSQQYWGVLERYAGRLG